MAQADFNSNVITSGGPVNLTTTNTTNNIHGPPPQALSDATMMAVHRRLLNACRHGHIELVKTLLDSNSNYFDHDAINYADPDDNQNAALHLATKANREDIVRLLLGRRLIDVNATNKDGATALILASGLGYIDIVTILLRKPGINVNAQNKKGDAALKLAVRRSGDIVRLLLDQPKIDVNRKGDSGRTALFGAASRGSIDCMELLLRHPNIDPNIQDVFGTTPLMEALSQDRTACALRLLKCPDIKVNHRDRFGFTTLEWVGDNTDKEVIKLLRDKGASARCYIA